MLSYIAYMRRSAQNSLYRRSLSRFIGLLMLHNLAST